MSASRATRRLKPRTGNTATEQAVAPLRWHPIAASLAQWGRVAQILGVASLPLWCAAPAGAQTIPVAPRVPATALPVAPTTQYGTPIGYQTAGNIGTITQTAPTNIVRWNSFDVGSAATLNIVQPSANAVLLNKVDGGAYLNQTVIDGVMNANGRVYLYNPNGVIFGKTATVNVDTLLASSLKFDESRVIGGLLQPGALPVLGADPALFGLPGAVVVEGDATGQAKITAGKSGLILLAAPNVLNNGVLNAPDGQVMLAAGGKVYLAAPEVSKTGTSLRGLLVEVSNDYAAGMLAPAATVNTSTAENAALGQISVGQGNATMIAHAVNQNGSISASTSVNLNGSIYLYARDQATRPDANNPWAATRTGKLTLGQNSVTQILPTLTDTAATSASTAFNKSDVKLNGENIELQQNAQLLAQGGNVSIKAERLPNNAGYTNPDGSLNILDPKSSTAPRVDFAAGSVVDVSGSTGTTLAMESNVITVDLRGTELADNIVLRDSPIYGNKAQIDIRKGTAAANVSGWIGLVQYNLGQKNAGGGTVSVNADGAIIQRAGSKINVDGGWVDYLSGYVNTSKLQLGEKLVDIGSALANTPYSAVVNVPNDVTNFEQGYRQGSSAGTIRFSAPLLVQQGTLSGHAVAGLQQRDPSAAGYPQGGQLQVGNVTNELVDVLTGKAKTALADQFAYAGNIIIGGTTTATSIVPAVGAAFDLNNLFSNTLDLNPAVLELAGFNRITALTSGNIRVDTAVKLPAGGKLWLGAGQGFLPDANGKTHLGGEIQINAPIAIAGGSLTAAASGLLRVADGVNLDLAGRWVNDQAVTAPLADALGNPIAPLAIKGGVLNLSANQLLIGNNVSADVSAGATLSAAAKTSYGSAGSITLQADPLDAVNAPAEATLQLGANLKLSGYGFSSGGSLKLLGRNVTLGAAAASATDLGLQAAFFQQGGFTNYDIAANVNLTVAANTTVQPRASNWLLTPQFTTQASGAMSLAAIPYLHALNEPTAPRVASNLTLRANSQLLDSAGRLLVDNGAKIQTDPGANLSLYAGRQLTEYGLLSAPAGRIVLGLTPNAGSALFNASRSIWFGAKAQVFASGSTQRLFTNVDGITSGEILDGGSIQVGLLQNGVLTSAAGYVVAETGALFDVSGAGAFGLSFKSNGAITPKQDIGSSGGSIDIRAREGLLFSGTLRGAAGGKGAAGGSLSIALDREGQLAGGYPDAPEVLTIAQVGTLLGRIVPLGLQPNQPIVTNLFSLKGVDLGWYLAGSKPGTNARLAGQGWIGANAFNTGGFGRLNFKSQDVLAFALGRSNMALSAVDALVLDAPVLRALNYISTTPNSVAISRALSLAAPYIQLGSADQRYQTPAAASTGSGQLIASATNLDLIGNSALQGFGTANLNAKADIRLVGLGAVDANFLPTGYTQGSLSMVGKLKLTDAQTYPTTLSDFIFSVAGNGTDVTTGALTFASNGKAAQSVLSAGGSLTAYANHITQSGRVLAPLGTIALGNLDSAINNILTSDLTYSAGSVTSVAGAGIVPFGVIANGSVPTASDWQYTLSDGTLVSIVQNPSSGGSRLQRALPSKVINSHAQNINAAAGSLQDLSGGGSLFAYEFTPGKGGSKDVLANNTPGSKTTVFAINPNFTGAVAPIDGTYGSDGGLKSGDAVYLSGMPGLPAGIYTLLPAHYALLSGGFSVTAAAASSRDMQASSNLVQADGSMLVAGRLLSSGSGTGSTRSSGFVVTSNAVVNKKSEFALSDASSYFTNKAVAAGLAAPETPLDGGRIAFDASGITAAALALDGSIKLNAATAGRNGTADIAASQIEVLGATTISTSAAVKLRADMLTAMNADSLLLGGVHDGANGGTHIKVSANSVTLSNDAASSLSGADITLVANNSVQLNAGASLQGVSTAGHAASDITLDGNGALLRVSGGNPIGLTRSNASMGVGSLNIGTGALIAANGSAMLDATGSVSYAGGLQMAAGSALSVGAPSISLGSALPTSLLATQLKFGTTDLASFSSLSSLILNSYNSTIDLYGAVTLGGAATRSLSLRGAGLQGYNSVASLIANSLSLSGTTAISLPALSAPLGTLTAQSNTLQLGGNAFAIRGFTDTALSAQGELLATATSGQLNVEQNLSLAAGRIASSSGAHAAVNATGNMLLTQAINPTLPTTPAGMGGQLDFTAASIASDALIEAPSGKVSMTGTNGVNITGGHINAAGHGVVFGSTTAYAPGGSIALQGAQISLATAASLDVSAVGAAAGSVSLNKTDGAGGVQLLGTIKGDALASVNGALPTQGQFSLNTDQVGAAGDFGALNAQLNGAGFTESRQFRFRTGDVALAGNDNVTAHQISIAVDNGNLDIGGNAVLNAAGDKGGSIGLYASQAASSGASGKVTLSGAAQLLANATGIANGDAGSVGNGGSIVIGTGSADGLAVNTVNGGSSINLLGGRLDVSGSSATRNGTVTLRAPSLTAGNEVAVGSLSSAINNGATTKIEGYRVYQASSITEAADAAGNLNAGNSGAMYRDATLFGASNASILARLNNAAASISLLPGIEVRALSGDLTVSVNEFAVSAANRGWDLSTWRFGGAPVNLTLRAANHLNIVGSISDGFVKPTSLALAMPDWSLGTGASASYRLVGGANFAAANPLAVNTGAGDVLFNFAKRTPVADLPGQILDVSTGAIVTTSAAPVKVNDAPVALVRTGTGSIDVAAGRDVRLGMADFFVYRSSDPTIEGTPVVYDAVTPGLGNYKISLYGAALYTAGQAAPLLAGANFSAPQNALNTHYGAAANTLSSAAFGVGGGALTIDAGGSVGGQQNTSSSWFYRNADGQAAVPADTTTKPVTPATPAVLGTPTALPGSVPQLVNDWLFRQGRSYIDANGNVAFEKLSNGTTLNTAWWSRYDYFNQGVATFGGGDVRVNAATGNVSNLSASVASNAYMPNATPTTLNEQGGGDLSVRAGGDILGGSFYTQKGAASLRADGSVAAGSYVPNANNSTAPLNTVLALGDARVNVTAGRSVAIEAAYNPMLTEQSVNNVAAGNAQFGAVYGVGGGGARWDVTDVTAASLAYRQQYAQFSNFSTYSTGSAVNLTAVGGNLLLSNDVTALKVAGGNDISNSLGFGFPSLYALNPARLTAVALSGNLSSLNGFTLMPAAQGQLNLLAAGNVRLNDGVNAGIRMLDNAPEAMSNLLAPRIFTPVDFNIMDGTANGIAAHTLLGLHSGDSEPARLVALTGDVVGDSSKPTTLALPKFAEIVAGRDIYDLGFSIQHNSANDVSTITAGRDFVDSTQSNGLSGDPSPVKNIVTGRGRIDLAAGRQMDFGNGNGLVTRGNLDNPYLAEGGAGINILAGGAAPDYAAFVAFATQYGSANAVASAPQDLLDLRAFVAARVANFSNTASAENLWAAFRALSAADQSVYLGAHPALVTRLADAATQLANAIAAADKPALNASFFTRVVEMSKQTSLGNFDQLIASLYPTATASKGGDISVFASQIKTEQGGAINLFSPAGSVYAGLTTGTASKAPSAQGIFTIRGGAIAALVKNDFLVNQGRVFTLGGGDISLISQYANIDAGRGAKTASSAPPPLITIDGNGNVKVDVSSSISGSGIATLKTRADQPDSNVYPIAPRGIFDAGDAGVRSSGSVEVVARIVLNAANISAGGSISGAQTAVAAPSLGSVAAPSSATNKSDDIAKSVSSDTAKGENTALNVEVLGYGEDKKSKPNADTQPGKPTPVTPCTDDDQHCKEKSLKGESV